MGWKGIGVGLWNEMGWKRLYLTHWMTLSQRRIRLSDLLSMIGWGREREWYRSPSTVHLDRISSSLIQVSFPIPSVVGRCHTPLSFFSPYKRTLRCTTITINDPHNRISEIRRGHTHTWKGALWYKRGGFILPHQGTALCWLGGIASAAVHFLHE
jgi:hypothetical protein